MNKPTGVELLGVGDCIGGIFIIIILPEPGGWDNVIGSTGVSFPSSTLFTKALTYLEDKRPRAKLARADVAGGPIGVSLPASLLSLFGELPNSVFNVPVGGGASLAVSTTLSSSPRTTHRFKSLL